MRRPHGFTLVELLFAVAAVAILAGALFPVLSKARERGHEGTCVSNLRQLSQACLQYTIDNDGTFPSAAEGAHGSGLVGGWMYYSVYGLGGDGNGGCPTAAVFDATKGSLFSYVKSTSVYVCPDDVLDSTTGDSYAINACVVANRYVTKGAKTILLHPGNPLKSITNPSATMLFGEEDDTKADGHVDGSTNDAFLSLYWNDSVSDRHSGGSNIAFVDGHVKLVRFPDNIGDRGVNRNAEDVLTALQTGGEPLVGSAKGGALCPN